MENSELQTATQEHDSQGHEKAIVAPQHVNVQSAAPLDLFFGGASRESQDGGATRLLRSPSLSHSANDALRAIAFRRAQQTCGNRFVQRALAGGCIQHQTEAPSTTAPIESNGHDVISPDSGEPLDPMTRGFMESRFSTDFGQVRVHTGTSAAESAAALNAVAYTSGRDIYFAEGKYSPQTREGQHLIAHELTHTIQQGGEATTPKEVAAKHHDGMLIGPADDPLEYEADRAADSVLTSGPDEAVHRAPAGYTEDGVSFFSPAVADHPRRNTIEAHEAVHRAQFALGLRGQAPSTYDQLETEAQQGTQEPGFIPRFAAPAGMRLFSPDSIPMQEDIGRFGEQETRDLRTVRPGVTQEPSSEINIKTAEDPKTHAQDIDYDFSARAQGERGSITSHTLLHLHRDPSDPHQWAVPSKPELKLVGDPKYKKLYPISISYGRTINYTDEYGRKLEVELKSNVWFDYDDWQRATAGHPDLTLAAMEQLEGAGGHMTVRISGQGELNYLLAHDYPSMPADIKKEILQGSGLSYTSFVSCDGRSLREMTNFIGAALKNTPGAYSMHLSDVPGSFVELNRTGGEQYDLVRTYLESYDKVHIAALEAAIRDRMKNPGTLVSGPTKVGTGTIDLSSVADNKPGLLDKLASVLGALWDSLPGWLRGTLKAVGVAALIVGGVLLLAEAIVAFAGALGIELALGSVAFAIGGILMTGNFLLSIVMRSIESSDTGSGNPLTIFLSALGDTFGISQIIEAIRNKSILSGTPLNLNEEQKWQRGVGGGLQFLGALLGVRSWVKGRVSPIDLPPETPTTTTQAPPQTPTQTTPAPTPAPTVPAPQPAPTTPAPPPAAPVGQYNPAVRTGAELIADINPTPQPGETLPQARARAMSAVEHIYNSLGEQPPRVTMQANDAANPAAHGLERHGPGVALERAGAPPGTRTVEGRIYGDPPWNQPGEGGQQNYSFRWTNDTVMNRAINDYLRAHWEQIRSDLAMNLEHDATFNAGASVGEGYYNQRMFQPGAAANPQATFITTRWVTIVIRVVPGNPPGFYIHTAYPTVNFMGGNVITQ